MNMNLFEQTTMTSVELAEISGKRHDHVKTDIERIFGNVGIDIPKFREVSKNHQNQEVTIYRLPKKETLLVTSKWSDEQRWKIINKLEEKENYQVKDPRTKFMIDSLIKLDQVESKQREHDHRIEAIEDKQKLQDGDTGYMTIVAYCRLHGIPEPLRQAQKHGKHATKLSKSYGITIGKVPDERWGTVNSYSVDVLDEIFEGWNDYFT